jgi:hypothetical protein
MRRSDILLYEKDYTPFSIPSEYFESAAYQNRQKDFLQKIDEILKERPNQETPHELRDVIDDLDMLVFGDATGDEVVLPCPAQKFLALLKRAIIYTEAMNGKIKLMRNEKTLLLFITAPFVCLNYANVRFFLELLELCFNIDFVAETNSDVTIQLSFHDVGDDTQMIGLDTFLEMIAQMNET